MKNAFPIAGQHIGNLRGESGGEYIDDTVEHTGQWACFKVIEDTVLAAITQELYENTDAIIGPTFFAGDIIYGGTTSITLASGVVQAIKF